MQHMQKTVIIMPATNPEKKPTSTPGVGNWLHRVEASCPCLEASFEGVVAGEVVVGLVEEVLVSDDVEEVEEVEVEVDDAGGLDEVDELAEGILH